MHARRRDDKRDSFSKQKEDRGAMLGKNVQNYGEDNEGVGQGGSLGCFRGNSMIGSRVRARAGLTTRAQHLPWNFILEETEEVIFSSSRTIANGGKRDELELGVKGDVVENQATKYRIEFADISMVDINGQCCMVGKGYSYPFNSKP
ncbi:hypothetical protein LIER_19452 [Lithospermum erythrorhizon]|uniref:Uncharacterized protein n=1 Tax=Lithospermum erythrorhizon TaxID=34254 RepID=A0AAV3QM53_LITER